ncbi:MAG: tyrosine-type recombinase/integrase [Elusimicrobiota bacterium]
MKRKEQIIFCYQKFLKKERKRSFACISAHLGIINKFISYLENNNVRNFNYVRDKDVLIYLKHLEVTYARSYRAVILNDISHFFDYLKKVKIASQNLNFPRWQRKRIIRDLEKYPEKLSDIAIKKCLDIRTGYVFNLSDHIQKFIDSEVKDKIQATKTIKGNQLSLEKFNTFINQNFPNNTLLPEITLGTMFRFLKNMQLKNYRYQHIEQTFYLTKRFYIFLGKKNVVSEDELKKVLQFSRKILLKLKDMQNENDLLEHIKIADRKLHLDLNKHIEDFLDYLLLLGYSKISNHNKRFVLRVFNRYLDKIDIRDVNHIKPLDIINYLKHLKRNKRENVTVTNILNVLKSFFKYLTQIKIIRHDPTESIAFLKTRYTYIKNLKILTVEESEKLLKSVDRNTAEGKRDFAVLVILYGLGLRKFELSELNLDSVDFDRNFIYIRKAKNDRERHFPMLPIVSSSIKEYLKVRPKVNNPALFLSRRGSRLHIRTISDSLNRYAALAGIPREITPQTLRRTFASHLHNEKVDVSVIAEMLGHTNISLVLRYISKTEEELAGMFNSHPGLKAIRSVKWT